VKSTLLNQITIWVHIKNPQIFLKHLKKWIHILNLLLRVSHRLLELYIMVPIRISLTVRWNPSSSLSGARTILEVIGFPPMLILAQNMVAFYYNGTHVSVRHSRITDYTLVLIDSKSNISLDKIDPILPRLGKISPSIVILNESIIPVQFSIVLWYRWKFCYPSSLSTGIMSTLT